MHFNQSQYRGILWLLLLIMAVQLFFYFFHFRGTNYTFTENLLLDKEIDSLKRLASQPKKDTIYPFNPNFITDYKGYRLGLTVEQIDRLQAFRAQGKFVNSAQEFQRVTGVSDTLLLKISPSFKFPEWVTSKKNFTYTNTKPLPKEDINTASAEDLMKIYGIGEGFSARILKYRDKLQGFTYIEQLAEVYKLEKEVYERVAERFEVKTLPVIEKKDINLLNMYELGKIPYIHYGEGKKIVGLRSALGRISNFEELLQIEGFDKERIERLQLYLTIKN